MNAALRHHEAEVGEALGAYRLEALAGEGGMGRVFRAVHEKLGCTVAIKLLRRKYATQPAARELFCDEARTASRIQHPNLVKVTELVTNSPDGDSYYIMEWLDGTDLMTLLERHGTLTPSQVVDYGRQIASALGAVHAAGMVHRDIKPENIYVVNEKGSEIIKVLDLGVALAQGDKAATVAGTAAYLAPECLAGAPVDARTDIYSLGVVLYQLLTGTPPFLAMTLPEYAMKHLSVRPRPVKDAAPCYVPPTLSTVIDRCLEKDPADRFQSMAELEEALTALVPVATSRPRLLSRLLCWRRILVWVAAAMAVTSVIVLALHQAPDVREIQSVILQKNDQYDKDPMSNGSGGTHERLPVEVNTEPSGAEVLRDGMTLGTTPCRVRLPRGESTLELRRDGFSTEFREINPTEEPKVLVTLRPQPTFSLPGRASPQAQHPANRQ